MATAAEKMANNLNFGAIGKATELRNELKGFRSNFDFDGKGASR